MADLKLPAAIDTEYLKRSKATDLEKGPLGKSIVDVCKAFGAIERPLKDLDLGKVDLPSNAAESTKKVQEITKDVDTKIIKPLQALLSGGLKKLEDEANKALGDAKKSGKESVVRAILTAVKPFRTEVSKLIDGTVEELEGLAKGVKKPAKEEGDKKAEVKPNKDLARYNNMARKAVRELRSGKIKSIPFYFAAHKIKTPFKKGSKVWDNKSLVHMHAKAGPSSRAMLVKLIELSSPIVAYGEIRCEDRKKLIFDCTSPAANPKQLKDALLFQCGWAPPIKVIKGGKVEGDEAGDGEDSGETLPEDDDEGDTAVATAAPVAAKKPTAASPTTGKEQAGESAEDAKGAAESKALKEEARKRFTKRSADIQKAILAGDRKAKEVKDLAVKVAAEIGNSGDGKTADELMQQLDEILDTPSSVVNAAADVIGAAAESPELQQLARQIGPLRTRAVNGVTRVAEVIRRSYQGDPQAAKALEGAKRIDASRSVLTALTLETQLATLLGTGDKARRATLASQLRASVAKHRQDIVGHDLLSDIDNSDFDANLVVIKPYVDALAQAEALLGNIKP